MRHGDYIIKCAFYRKGEIVIKVIKTIEGVDVLVDEEDFVYLQLYDLYLNRSGYVYVRPKMKYNRMGLFSSKFLHKILSNPDLKGRLVNVDHIDGNKLNNQKINLRICSHQNNMRNRGKLKKKAKVKSKYKGVTWNKKCGKWKSHVQFEKGRRHFIGYFTNEEYAANAYNHYAKLYFGEYANLNEVEFAEKEIWEMDCSGSKKTSKYRGVSYVNGKWFSQIWNGKRNIKTEHESEIEAALAYNEKAIILKGNKAILNKI